MGRSSAGRELTGKDPVYRGLQIRPVDHPGVLAKDVGPGVDHVLRRFLADHPGDGLDVRRFHRSGNLVGGGAQLKGDRAAQSPWNGHGDDGAERGARGQLGCVHRPPLAELSPAGPGGAPRGVCAVRHGPSSRVDCRRSAAAAAERDALTGGRRSRVEVEPSPAAATGEHIGARQAQPVGTQPGLGPLAGIRPLDEPVLGKHHQRGAEPLGLGHDPPPLSSEEGRRRLPATPNCG